MYQEKESKMNSKIETVAEKVMTDYLKIHEQSVWYDEECVAAVIRTIANELQYYQCCEESAVENMVIDARSLYDLADAVMKRCFPFEDT